MKKLLTSLSTITLLLFSLNVYADLGGQLFKVNLIVFLQKNNSATVAEDLPNHLLIPYTKNTLELKPFPEAIQIPDAPTSLSATTSRNINSLATYNPYQYNGKTVYTLLPANKTSLRNTAKRLRNNGYKILLNVAWVQPAIQTNRWMHVFGGQVYNQQGLPITGDIDLNNMQTQVGASFWQINGMLKISYSNFFNIGLHLYLTQPSQLGSSVNAQQFGFVPLRTFQLFNFRRARPGQIVYFDHPLFGAFLLIRRVTSN